MSERDSGLAHGMHIHIRYFAALRETVGLADEDLELPAGADVAAARAALAERHPALAPLLGRCVAALNRAYVAPETALTPDDELVFIPPLGGGAPEAETEGGGAPWQP
jgi:molybdopterin converting factor subunit 1